MHADGTGGRDGELLERELTREIIGAFYDVYNYFGYGFLEAVYSNALAAELANRGIRVQREATVKVTYKGICVGVYRSDLTVEGRVVIESKATERLSGLEARQLTNYLRATGIQVGLVLHFGPKPSFRRVVQSIGLDPRPSASSA